MTRCSFVENQASGTDDGNGGGGIRNTNDSSPVLNDCTFTANLSRKLGGGILNHGSSPTLTECMFTNNSAGEDGGGIWNESNSNMSMTDCTFMNNQTQGGIGAAMYNQDSSPILTECNFCGNLNPIGFISLAGGGYDPSSTGNPPLDGPCVLGDMNFDGVVNLADRNDLNTLIGVCAADVNGDGTVDGADLAYVLGYWGLCSAP